MFGSLFLLGDIELIIILLSFVHRANGFSYVQFEKSYNLVFLVQIGESAGAECKAILQEVNGLVEQRLAFDGFAVKSLFGAASVWILFNILFK